MLSMQPGDVVRRRKPWDGSKEAGIPYGPVLTVLKTYPLESYSVCKLSDGRHEFDFNLQRRPTTFECSSSDRRAG